MQNDNAWNPTLHFWDVPAALVGFAAASVLEKIPLVGGYSFLWVGGPIAFVTLRRLVFPRPAGFAAAQPEISLARRLGAYACIILGGVIALIAGTAFYLMATDARQPTVSWELLVALAVGGGLATLGVKEVTPPLV